MDTDTRELCIKRLQYFIEGLSFQGLKLVAAFASGVYKEESRRRE